MSSLQEIEADQDLSFWDCELTVTERNHVSISWSFLEDAGIVSTENGTSATSNMKKVFDYMLQNWPNRYENNLDVMPETDMIKYSQIYQMIAHSTRKLKTAVATSYETPQKHHMTQGEEHTNTYTQSSLKKKKEVSSPYTKISEETPDIITGDEFLQSHQDDIDQALAQQSFERGNDP